MFKKIFLEHPHSVGESYMEHQGFALAASFRLFTAAFACLIHAFVPGLLEKTASRIVREMYTVINGRS